MQSVIVLASLVSELAVGVKIKKIKIKIKIPLDLNVTKKHLSPLRVK